MNLVTEKEARALLYLKSRKLVYDLVRAGEIDALFMHGKYMIVKDSIERYLERKRVRVVGGVLMKGGKEI